MSTPPGYLRDVSSDWVDNIYEDLDLPDIFLKLIRPQLVELTAELLRNHMPENATDEQIDDTAVQILGSCREEIKAKIMQTYQQFSN